MIQFETLTDVKDFIDRNSIEMIKFVVSDIDGRLRNVTIPAENINEKIINDGIGFDASNLGFASVSNSDMVMKPDLKRAYTDPVSLERKDLHFLCNVFNEEDNSNFNQDLRSIVSKALNVLKAEGVADEMKIGLELEFNVLDALYSRMTLREIAYKIQSSEFTSPNDGAEIFRIASNRGYFRNEPNDHLYEIRCDIVKALKSIGLDVKYHHHEVGSSQVEIEFLFFPVEHMADGTVLAKNICHRVGSKYDKIVSFLPKLIPGEAGNGMHVHMFLTKDGENVFHNDRGLYQLSDVGLYFIGGILKHASSLLALTNPTTISYRRLIPGFEAPVKAVFAKSNRSAAIRIPGYVKQNQERRFEFRTIDATCNPYLAYAGIIMAGYDGVVNKIDPREEGFGPFEKNLYKMSQEELSRIQSFPASLDEALHALEADHDYLVKNNVFPLELLEKWVKVKRDDISEMRSIPHPWEVARYYDL